MQTGHHQKFANAKTRSVSSAVRKGGRVVYRGGLENRAFSSDKGFYRGKDTNRYERCGSKSMKILSI